jgi:circadian clock protein KaiC
MTQPQNVAPQPTRRLQARLPTGIDGFDEIADGGLPRGGITVVMGGAGAGKTIFSLQVLAMRARASEPGILVAFEETADRILDNTAGFAWGGQPLKAAVEVLDAQLSQSVEKAGAFDLIGLLAIVAARAKKSGAKLVVFDGLDVLLDYLHDSSLVRREVFRIREWVHASGLSAVVTAKADATEARPLAEYDFLQFMADCVVTMHHRVVHGTATRTARVAKYRGAAHSSNEFPVTITRAGLEVAASTTSQLAHAASGDRVSTGVERLDAMLSGGYHRGSSVLITGVPGTAKTTLAAAFAEAAGRRGERTLFVSFDEAPDQIVRNVASVGIQFRPLIEAGILHLTSFRARADNPEAHVARLRGLLRDLQPQNLVVDPLSAMSRSGVQSDAAAVEVLDFAKSAGITIVSTSLLANAVPLAEQTPLNLSTIADAWLHVSYLSQGGERNRSLTIIKARGTSHSNQVRELVLSDKGVTLTDVYSVGGEVLMGTLRWEKENDLRRSRVVAKSAVTLRAYKVEQALAETKARLQSLAREQAMQEVELAQIRAEAEADADRQTTETEGLLQRRRADRTAPSSSPPAQGGGASSGGPQ